MTRLGTLLPQLAVFRFLPVDDFSFVLPTFVFALGTHAVSLCLARDLFGARGAFLTSLFFLTSPFETLTATAFSPDYFVAFWTLLAIWGCWRGRATGRLLPMGLGGLALACALFSKTSALIALPVFALATVASPRRWRGWLAFWVMFGVGVAAVSLVFWWLGGSPFVWYLNRADRPEGHDVTAILGYVLGIYPRYLFLREPDYGHWMFGVTGWVAILGIAAALVGAWTARWGGASRVILLFFVGLLLLNFMPHKLTLGAYYSHPRIFRYLAQVSALVYLSAAFFVELLLRSRARAVRTLGVAVVAAACAFGLWEAPRVSEPSWDANRDGRALSRFFHAQPSVANATIQSDYWHCYRLEDMNWDQHLQFRCPVLSVPEERQRFLEAIRDGWVITGGGRVAWYSTRDWGMDLTTSHFTPPPTWRLMFERDGPERPWRREPLRVWVVEPAADAPKSP